MKKEWYSVKCLFYHPTRTNGSAKYLYEERITLWAADSFADAFKKAEQEAKIYASEAQAVFCSAAYGFRLFDSKISSGTEVYALMRDSNLYPHDYEETFCVTPLDRA